MKLNEMIDSFAIVNKEELGNIMDETIENMNISVLENMSSRNLLFKTINKDKTLIYTNKEEQEKHIFLEDNLINDNLNKHKFECKFIYLFISLFISLFILFNFQAQKLY